MNVKRRIAVFLVISILFWATGLLSLPAEVLADHKPTHNPPGQAKITPVPEAAPGQDKQPDKLQDDKDKDKDKPQELKPEPKQPVVYPPLPLKFKKNLQPGAQGEEVRELQRFLKQFPAIYPEGLVTGNFERLTQNAIKKLQKNLGLPESGTVDEQITRKLNELDRALARKNPPKISEIAPSDISVDTTVTLTGDGFTLENNSLFVRGKIILTSLISHDGSEIVFSLPAELPCEVGIACPIKIVNSNGISNAKVFKLSDPRAPPTEEPPPPEPAPVPPPAPAPPPATIGPPTVSLYAEQTTVMAGQPFTMIVSGTSDIGLAAVWWAGKSTGVKNATVSSTFPATPISSGLFTTPVTNPTSLDRAFGSPLFSSEQAVRSYSFTSTVTIPTAGEYEFGANSRDVLYPVAGEPHQASEGAGLASLKITVVEPVPPPPPLPLPTADIKANNADGPIVISYNTAATISWSSEDADFCSVFPANWSGISGTRSTGNLIASAEYILSCSGPGGSASDRVIVNVSGPPPPPNITLISPAFGTVGAAVTILGKDFTPTGNEVHFVDVSTDSQAIVAGVASSDGLTLDFQVPADIPCSELKECTIFVKNANGNSDSLKFFRTMAVVPVLVHSPNGGETIVQEQGTTLDYSGGNLGLYLGIAAETAATDADPSGHILGWVWSAAAGAGTTAWDGKTVCGFPGCSSTTTRWTIEPGNYKVVALSHNEFGKPVFYDSVTGKLGNFDLSDQAFSVISVPTPALSVVSPNGGEAYKHGDAVTITWEAENLANRSVNIRLLRNGSVVSTIASNVPQSETTGFFLYNWMVPSTLAPGSDYAIEIFDATNPAVKDASDGQFRIAANTTLQIYGPNGGETAMRGFSALLFWTYNGYTPASINVNLYRGGTFYRTLATGVKPVGFSGFSFQRDPYPYNSRYAEIPLPLDIPEGDDYVFEIVDGADSTILDRSDAALRIITLPSPMTFKGRLVDALSEAPVANVSFGGYSGNSNLDGTSYNVTLPRFTTDANGEFSYATTTEDLVAVTRSKALFAGWPSCHDAFTGHIYRYADLPRISFSGWYNALYPSSSVRRQYVPLTTPVMDFGDVTDWPTVDMIRTFTDIPSAFYVYYKKQDGTTGGGMGNTNHTLTHTLQNAVPLDIDAYVQFKDWAGNLYTSPAVRVAADARCQIATLSFMDGVFQWEPYPIGISISAPGGAVGTLYRGTLQTYTSTYGGISAGIAPYTWNIVSGSLPPGLSLNAATGEITGTPTAAGTYSFGATVKDSAGVRASRDPFSISIQP